jgi:hypothetical protein
MEAQIVFAKRFVGPPHMAQGGYVGGVLARMLGDDVVAEVRLSAPTPLETALDVDRPDPRSVRLLHDGALIAACTVVEPEVLEMEVPVLVGYEAAALAPELPEYMRAGAAVPEVDRCIGCLPRWDGLQMHPGRVPGTTSIACPVVLPADLAIDGRMPFEMVWAAVDCPSMWACWLLADAEEQAALFEGALFTGSLAVSVERLPSVDERLYVQAWRVARERRKITGCAVLVTEDGEIVARARQIAIATVLV